jgi:hypothetical protein
VDGAGLHPFENSVHWDGKDLNKNYVTGMFFIVLEINQEALVKKKRKIIVVRFD